MKALTKCATVLALFLLTLLSAHAQTLTDEQLLQAATQWTVSHAVLCGEARPAGTVARLTAADGTALPLCAVPLAPKGCLVMGTRQELPQVLACLSTNKPVERLESLSPLLRKMVQHDGTAFLDALAEPKEEAEQWRGRNRARWRSALGGQRTRGSDVSPATILQAPLLKTTWGQDHPFNALAPGLELNSPNRCWAGCVALSLAEIMRYYSWPPKGNGSLTWQDKQGSVKATLYADFEYPYDWSLFKDRTTSRFFDKPDSSDVATARLLFDCAVACSMNYEIAESLAQVSQIATFVSERFGFETPVYGDIRKGYEGQVPQTVLVNRIRNDLLAKRPVIANHADHGFVIDGLARDGDTDYYHYQYGWLGEDDGWYAITTGYDDTPVVAALTGLYPQPRAVFRPMAITQAADLTLTWDFPACYDVTAFRLKAQRRGRTTIVTDAIDGTLRQWSLTGQEAGEVAFALEAQVDGEWQTPSDALSLKVDAAAGSLPEIALEDDCVWVGNSKSVSLTVQVTPANANLAVATSRPDHFGTATVKGNGATRTVTLPVKSTPVDNALAWMTVTDADGNVSRKPLPLLAGDGVLNWEIHMADAQAAAASQGKLILLVFGESGPRYYTSAFREQCENKAIKELIRRQFVPLFVEYIPDEPVFGDLDREIAYNLSVGRGELDYGENTPWIMLVSPDNLDKTFRHIVYFKTLTKVLSNTEVLNALSVPSWHGSGEGRLSFEWRRAVASDKAALWVDGQPAEEAPSGIVWKPVTLELGEGDHAVYWDYQPASGTRPEDEAWLRNVTWEIPQIIEYEQVMNGDGVLRFNWKLLSAEDTLTVFVDGEERLLLGGETLEGVESLTFTNDGAHRVTWRCRAAAGSHVDDAWLTLTAFEKKLTLELNAGWNLVAFPFVVNADAAPLATFDLWQSAPPQTLASGMLEPAADYWLYNSAGPRQLLLRGNALNLPELHYRSGWNFSALSLSSFGAPPEGTAIWQWNGIGFERAGDLLPGRGYIFWNAK